MTFLIFTCCLVTAIVVLFAALAAMDLACDIIEGAGNDAEEQIRRDRTCPQSRRLRADEGARVEHPTARTFAHTAGPPRLVCVRGDGNNRWHGPSPRDHGDAA